MSPGFRVDLGSLRCAAADFGLQGQRLALALATLQEQLDALGAPWGDDKQGRAWADSYEPCRPKIENALALLSEGLGSVQACLMASAENHMHCERANIIAARPGAGGPGG